MKTGTLLAVVASIAFGPALVIGGLATGGAVAEPPAEQLAVALSPSPSEFVLPAPAPTTAPLPVVTTPAAPAPPSPPRNTDPVDPVDDSTVTPDEPEEPEEPEEPDEITPGAFCGTGGATGYYRGRKYTCKGPGQDRWRR